MLRIKKSRINKASASRLAFLPAMVLAMFMCVLLAKPAYARDVRVFFNGNEIRYDVPATIIADYTMVPLSQTFEALVGMGTVYDPATRTSTFYANGHTNMHTIGSNIVYIDGVPNYYPTASAIIRDRALVPIRMITDTSGLLVEWDEINYFVKISSKTAPTPVPTQAPAPTPQQPDVQILSFTSDKTTLNQNESVVLTVKTNATATNVWVNDGSNNHPMTYATLESNSIKTWVLAFSPKQTVNLQAYANTSQQTTGAAQKALALTVNTQPPQISSATADKTNIGYNESITITTKTNGVVNNVWIECNNTQIDASLQSTDASSGIKTWTAIVMPSATQQIKINANTAKNAANAATQSISVTVGNTASVIHSVTPNKTQIYAGEQVQLTIRTNNATQYLWVECNGSTSQISGNPQIDGAGVKTWYATIYPNATQQIRVYANSNNSLTNAAVVPQTLTVGGGGGGTASITGAYAQPQTVNSGSSTTIYVTTNSAVSYVRVSTGYETINLTLYQTDGYGNKTWTSQNYYPSASGTYTAYAGSNNGQQEVSRSFDIIVQGGGSSTGVNIYNAYASPANLTGGPTTFYAYTASGASAVSVTINGTSYTMYENQSSTPGQKSWYTTFTINVPLGATSVSAIIDSYGIGGHDTKTITMTY